MSTQNRTTTQPGPADHAPNGWYGLVRTPVPGAEILPVVCSRSLGIVRTQRYAEQFVVGRAVAADLAAGNDEWDRLGTAVTWANEMTDELDDLSSDSLLTLIDCMFDLAVATGREWLVEVGDSHALHYAWWTLPQRTAPGRAAHDLLKDIEDTWLSPGPNEDTVRWSAAQEVVGSCRRDELISIIETLADAVVRVAMAALEARPGYVLDALSQSTALFEPPIDVVWVNA